MTSPIAFGSLVFAGGGNRCLWQAGFWDVVKDEMALAPENIAGVSAGATMACMIFSGSLEKGLENFTKATGANSKNIYLGNLIKKRPVFPHLKIYRETILSTIDETALKRLHEGPDIRVLLTRPQTWLPAHGAALVALVCYTVEKTLLNPVHPKLAARTGLEAEVASVRDCRTPEDLADLLLASSCTPPVTPILKWRGRDVLDGGMIDNVPIRALGSSKEHTLVLLTRRYPSNKIPIRPKITYVQPSIPITISKWDYTNPKGVLDTFALGQKDGRAFLERNS